MSKITVGVLANIEIDVDKIINEIMYKDDCNASDVSMDDIFNYISKNITFLSGKAPGIYEVADGPSVSGFGDDLSYDRVEELLENRIKMETDAGTI